MRTAVEALAAVLGGTNSLHTNALDEVLALPSAKAAEIALRTQQVLMEETGVVNVADPLGGSWYVEALTDELERQAEAIFARITDMGETAAHGVGTMTRGILRGIEDGWFMSEIADAAFTYQKALEKGDKKVVGVNVHESSVAEDLEILRISHEVELEQRRVLDVRKKSRDENAARGLRRTSGPLDLLHRRSSGDRRIRDHRGVERRAGLTARRAGPHDDRWPCPPHELEYRALDASASRGASLARPQSQLDGDYGR